MHPFDHLIPLHVDPLTEHVVHATPSGTVTAVVFAGLMLSADDEPVRFIRTSQN